MNAELGRLALRWAWAGHGLAKLETLDPRGHSERVPLLEITKRLAGGSLAWQVAGQRTLLTGMSLAEELACGGALLPEGLLT